MFLLAGTGRTSAKDDRLHFRFSRDERYKCKQVFDATLLLMQCFLCHLLCCHPCATCHSVPFQTGKISDIMLHGMTLERLLTFPENNSHSNSLRRLNFLQAFKESIQSPKGIKRKLSPGFCDGRRSKYRHQENSLVLPITQCGSKNQLNFLPTNADVLSKGLYLPPLSLPDSLNSAHWCYTKICPKKLGFVWTIENFSLSVAAPGETVVSQTFPVHANKDYVWSLHVAPHGKCSELQDYVSVCLVMESKRQRDGHPPQTPTAAASLLPARFRCSLLDQLDRVAYTNETERYHLVGPKMGLGFCRFVERSRLYPPPGVDTRSATASGRKDGPPAASATLTTNDHLLVGPGDRVKFFAEIFWIEEEVHTSASEDIPSNADSMDGCDCPSEVQTSTDLHTDLERLLLSDCLADVTVTVATTAMQKKCSSTALVDIPHLSFPIACDCSDCVAPMQGTLEFHAHKAILAAASPKLLRIFSSKNAGQLHEATQKLVFCGSGLNSDVIPIFLRYVYTNRIDRAVSHTQLVSLLRLSYQLEMPALANLVEQGLGGILSAQNACSILTAAVDLRAQQLVDSCLSYVFRNAESIIDSVGYQSLCTKRPDILSLLFCQLARYRSRLPFPTLLLPHTLPPPRSPSPSLPTNVIPPPRPFTFGEGEFNSNSTLTTDSTSGLSSNHKRFMQPSYQRQFNAVFSLD
ncbi:speckle type POZ protein [Echinococcus multilocularis]|uniref:Speckle type POZ protein n=1 Tax=Echinococcus multilocularis TaxID=6211 RepID=A0A068Y0S0_ECHMU|nr:speckle type POZ protein [Echinococcus multilocularis]